jgi:hypothetical protein
MSWWKSASVEQRLAQIDGGIECWMTARQVAAACGLRDGSHVVASFAAFHRRSFLSGRHRTSSAIRGRAAKLSARAAYMRGERVDFWRDDPQDRGKAQDDIAEVAFE